MSKLEKLNNKLVLKPEIKLETNVIEIQKDYVVLGCYVVAIYNNGQKEIIETFYRTISIKDFQNTSLGKINQNLYLPITIEKKTYGPVVKIYFNKIISPYKTIDFLFSQPTRGPDIV
jgi:hypothetical protein